jgi:hypothetical protein
VAQLTIAFAGSSYRFCGLVPEQLDSVRSKFEPLISSNEATPDVSIDIHYTPSAEGFMRRPVGPAEYRVAIAASQRGVAAAGIGFTANIDRTPLRAQLHTCLTDLWFAGAFENLFRIVASYRLFEQGGLVLHSAALVDDGRGFLFCGRSGAGKTTLCGLARELEIEVLSDELNAVVPTESGYALCAMPFAGDFGGLPIPGAPYPLRGLMGLEHTPEPRLRGCSKAEAVSRIVASCPYINADPQLTDALVRRARDLNSQVPLRILSFAKTTSFWRVLNDEYRDGDG